jgi:uncharacterized protein YecE (DUF72 family)
MPLMVYIGTASWTDPGFLADWYPKKIRRDELLPYYAEHFNAVEVNSTFYALQRPETIEKWLSQTPAGFIFDFKLPGIFSWHKMDWARLPKRIKDMARPNPRGKVDRDQRLVEEMLLETRRMLEPARKAKRLGTLLLQLSPAFSPKTNKLDDLDFLLDHFGYPIAVEFRNRGWLEDERLKDTMDYLADHEAVFVNLDAPKGEHFTLMPETSAVTNKKISYLRAHGRNAEGFIHGRSVPERFDYDYSDEEIKQIKNRVDELIEQAENVHVIFNNNKSNYAPKAAERLKQLEAN